MAAEPENACAAVVRALGFDPSEVVGLTLKAYGGEPPTLEVQHIPPYEGEALKQWEAKLAAAVRRYKLVEDTG